MLSQELDSDACETETAKQNGNGADGGKNDIENGGSGNEVRVKKVSEINSNIVTSNDVTAADTEEDAEVSQGPNDTALCGTKRKLPAWMEKQQSDTDEAEASCSKKQRVAANNEPDPEVREDESTNEGDPDPASTTAMATAAQIKIEPEQSVEVEPSTETEDNAACADAGAEAGADAEVDALPSSSGSISKPPFDVKPAIKVEKADASSTSRESCRFGIRCYRRNPMHRIEEAHPGDHDYKRPNYPTPPLGTPACPYGNSCYRRNPSHFAQYSHPPDTDFEKNYRMRLRIRLQRQQTITITGSNDDDDSILDEYDLEDPFLDDGDLDEDYVPSNDEAEDEADEDEGVDYDDCDKAEE